MAATVTLLAQRQQSISVDPARERARQPYQTGLEHLRREAFDAAVKSFEEAVRQDPTFDMAHYMLGRTHMMSRSYKSAIVALSTCRDLHLSEASTQTINRQDVQRQRRQRIDEINDRVAQLELALPTARNADQLRNEIRMLQERKRQIEDAERELPTDRLVPAFVSLALGSAWFRTGNTAEAEKYYREAIAADGKAGEAHSNLAVVFMETGRLEDAERAVAAAEKTGFRVHPQLKKEIQERKGAKSDS